MDGVVFRGLPGEGEKYLLHLSIKKWYMVGRDRNTMYRCLSDAYFDGAGKEVNIKIKERCVVLNGSGIKSPWEVKRLLFVEDTALVANP